MGFMGGGEVHRKEGADIIEYPENIKEMKKKYLEREEQQLKKVLARRKAESEQELKNIESRAIVSRAERVSEEHKPLKDRTILREAKSEEINDLKQKINEEINAIGQRILKDLAEQLPSLENKVIGLKQLKGRVSPGPAHSEEKIPLK